MSIPSDATALGCRRCGRAGVGADGLCATCRSELDGRTILAGEALTDAPLTPLPSDNGVTQTAAPVAPDGDSEATRPSGFGGGDGATATGNPAATPRPTGGGTADSKTGAARRSAGGETGPLTIGDRFGRYTIMRLLGIGGMGAVYQAWDAELDVVVALKVIRPEAIRDRAAEQEMERRFKRELLLARQVTHKNVVRIHDLGEIDGIKYITMTYVEGTDLATLIKKQGRLPLPMTLRVMKSVVSGLVAAHAAEVVHRDLKPANIMIGTDGEALIMDFGIARSSGDARTSP